MTDAEVIAQLRNSKGWPTLGHAAADHIEALAALHQAAMQDALAAEAYAGGLEAKLAKAVGTLRNVVDEYDRFRKDEYERGLSPLDDEMYDARATLAELKGNTND